MKVKKKEDEQEERKNREAGQIPIIISASSTTFPSVFYSVEHLSTSGCIQAVPLEPAAYVIDEPCCDYVALPKYRAVTYPQVFDGRKENTRVLKINDEITLDLEPSSVLHEKFFVRTYRDGVPEHKYYDVRDLQNNFYHDEKRLAAVMLFDEGGTLKVEGVVGPNLKIRPIETAERSADGRQAHLVENIEDSDSVDVHGKILNDKIRVAERAAGGGTRFDSTKYNVQKIYPEILVVVDSRLRQSFHEKEHAIFYFMVTIEVVNIRYRALRDPEISIVLRGLEFSEWDQEGLYYEYVGEDDIDGYKSLQKLVTFVTKRKEIYGSLDLVYFATGWDMVAVYQTTRTDSLEGYAFVASACTDNREQLGEDKAYTYKGIRIMTHEIGHTFGCSHDGTSASGVVRAFTPNSLQCPWGDGYIMSYEQEDSRSMKFSHCCQYDIRQLTWTYEANCLHRNDSHEYPLNWLKRYVLPGDYLSLNTQCKIWYPFLRKTYFLEEGVVGPHLKIRPGEASERSTYGDQAHIVDTIEDLKDESVHGDKALT
nr:coagulation factor X-activating enzyme heavy chain-like [Rhipicephalus microplus]